MPITKFRNDYFFLSNFYPCQLRVGGVLYTTSEHLYQASKTKRKIEKMLIASADTPGEAKKLGKKIAIIDGFDSKKFSIMESIIRLKFYGNDNLREMLLQTGDEQLIEGNTWGDTYWGCVLRDGIWVGENNLGKILMSTRNELKLLY